MTDGAPSPADLMAVLERLSVQPAGSHSPSEVTQAQLDLVLARITALTGFLRGAASNETTRLAARMLLGELTLVAARFRGDANATSASLERALDGVREALERVDDTPAARV